MKVTDIIIPVCNVNSDLLQCIERIIDNTKTSTYMIHIVYGLNMKKYIMHLSSKVNYKEIKFTEVKNYKSYFELANVVMEKSLNDVVIIDPYILVTENWLTNICKCAYDDDTIATVIPVCISGSISYSYNLEAKNEILFEGMSINNVSEAMKQASIRSYPEIPTAMGYCMFIKRDVINDVGLFDTLTYGKGFGEDKDYSWRALQFGYSHVMCDDTFVFCNSNAIFEANKKHRVPSKRMKQIYGRFLQDYRKFFFDNPLDEMQKRIKLFMLLKNGKKNVLFNLHYGFEKENQQYVGGTQIIVKEIVNNISYKHNCFVFSKDFHGFTLSVYIEEKMFAFKYLYNEQIFMFKYSNKDVAKIIRSILTEFSIDLVNIHHVIGQTFDMIYEAKKLDIPVVLSFHDYYFICPTSNLVSIENKFCIENQNESYCLTCLKEKYFISESILPKWREKATHILDNCDMFIAPSKSTKNIYTKFFPHISDKTIVIPHGLNKYSSKTKEIGEIGNKINVAFVGGVAPHKGSELLYQVIKHEKSNEYNLLTFGMIHDTRFFDIKEKHVVNYGAYEKQDIVDLLCENNINLVLLFTLCSETFCLVLSEVLEAGIPVIASNIGALGERVEEIDCGWLVPVEASAQQVIDLINYIINNPKEYEKKKQNILNHKARNAKDMAKDYLEIYDSLLNS